MDTLNYIRRLFSYDTWANLKILNALEAHTNPEEDQQAHSLFSHILVAQELWFRRATGGDLSDFEVWPEIEPARYRTMIETRESKWDELVGMLKEQPERTVAYHNTSGNHYITPLIDILHHIIIHGQHHRAQIARYLREKGIAPPATDFIFYTRETNNNI